MNLYTIDAGYFKLDGGAMFGVVPKTIWSKKIPADDLNLCSWAMRCLLVEDGNRLILIDTGMGDKQPEKWQNYYYRHGDGDLVKSIEKAGFGADEITDVLLSHLHFDHAGGAVKWNDDRTDYALTFPNAHYWTHTDHWKSAVDCPNQRESASFLRENLVPIYESGHLKFINEHPDALGEGFTFVYTNGHTEKMILPIIAYQDKKIVFAADTVPSQAHLPVPYVMGYDVRPLETMDEKQELLQRAVQENWIIFYDHDPAVDASTIQLVNGKYAVKDAGKLTDFL